MKVHPSYSRDSPEEFEENLLMIIDCYWKAEFSVERKNSWVVYDVMIDGYEKSHHHLDDDDYCLLDDVV